MQIKNDKIKKECTLVSLADLHHINYKFSKKYFDYVLSKIYKINPDYICFLGDILDESNCTEIKELLEFIKELLRYTKKEIIFILGNHDIMYLEDGKWIKGTQNIIQNDIIPLSTRIHLLDNKAYQTDEGINFIGITLPYEYYEKYRENDESTISYFGELLQDKTNNNNLNILLTHTSQTLLEDSVFYSLEDLKNIDLILSGHTHSGLTPKLLRIILNLVSSDNIGIISPQGQRYQKYSYGVIEKEQAIAMINEGIVKLSQRVPNASLINRLYTSDVQTLRLIPK